MKIFASVLYSTFMSFVLKSVKVKKMDFRSDSDFLSKALYEKHHVQDGLLDF